MLHPRVHNVKLGSLRGKGRQSNVAVAVGRLQMLEYAMFCGICHSDAYNTAWLWKGRQNEESMIKV